MDYEVQRFTRHCARSGRPLAEGEEFYSVLVAQGAQLRRYDFAPEAWEGPPDAAVGWWKSRVPTPESKRARLAPSEVLLQLFVELEAAADKLDMRYIMALLLVRRRVLRLEDTEKDELGREVLVLYAPRDETTHRVVSVTPSEARVGEIQDELARLLFADAL